MNAVDGIEGLAEELAERWISLLAPRDWPVRLQLLQQVHEQLRDDLGASELYALISPLFIRKVIERLSSGAITSTAQAHVYANSDAEEHRRAALEWLADHEPAAIPTQFALS
jgi:hypothetical protein